MGKEAVEMAETEKSEQSSEGRRSGRARKSTASLEVRDSEDAEVVAEKEQTSSAAETDAKKGGGAKRSRKEGEKGLKKEDDEKPAAKKKAKSQASQDGDEKKASAAMLVPSKKAKWKEGDTIFGLNRGDLYLAKVLKVRSDFKRGFPVWQYLLHYQKWAKKWDEWLNEEFTHPNTEKTLELQKTMKEANRIRLEAERKMRNKKADPAEEKKKESDSNIDFEAVEVTDKALKINIPNVLQRRLLDDLDMIEDRKLVALPRTPCVRVLMEDFVKSKGPQAAKDQALMEMIEGLEVYFDKALPTMLLYNFEFVQYKRMCSEHPNFRGSQMYGGEHLLRLFVKLPELMQQAQVTSAQAQALQPRIGELLKFMEKNVDHYLVASYDPADLEYMEDVQKARGR